VSATNKYSIDKVKKTYLALRIEKGIEFKMNNSKFFVMRNQNTKSKYIDAIVILMVLLLSSFSLFYNLSALPVKMWDEAIYANNSIEMMTDCNLLVVKHEGKPDLFNTKPPLVIWLQALSMKLFGINEFAIRFPSALFGLFTVLAVYFFCARVIKSRITGLFSVLVLITSKGFVGYHVTRTGDLDAVLVFWLTLYSLIFLTILMYPSRKPNYYFSLLSIGIIFAFLTKGVAGFLFLPSMLLISFLFGNHNIYKQKLIYIYAFFSLTVCIGYYILREYLSPGYLDLVINFEIFRISEVVASWQTHPFDFYIWLIVEHFYPFYYVLPLTIFLPFLFKFKSNEFKISIYLLILCIGYFVMISYPPVKLEWYDAPLYPIMAILIGLLITKLIKLLSGIMKSGYSKYFKYALIVILLASYTYPYRNIIESYKYPENIYVMERDGAYLKYLKTNYPKINNIKVFKIEKHKRHYDQVLFYKRAYEKTLDYKISIVSENSFGPGDFVIATRKEIKNIILEKYRVEEINNWKSGSLFKIIE